MDRVHISDDDFIVLDEYTCSPVKSTTTASEQEPSTPDQGNRTAVWSRVKTFSIDIPKVDIDKYGGSPRKSQEIITSRVQAVEKRREERRAARKLKKIKLKSHSKKAKSGSNIRNAFSFSDGFKIPRKDRLSCTSSSSSDGLLSPQLAERVLVNETNKHVIVTNRDLNNNIKRLSTKPMPLLLANKKLNKDRKRSGSLLKTSEAKKSKVFEKHNGLDGAISSKTIPPKVTHLKKLNSKLVNKPISYKHDDNRPIKKIELSNDSKRLSSDNIPSDTLPVKAAKLSSPPILSTDSIRTNHQPHNSPILSKEMKKKSNKHGSLYKQGKKPNILSPGQQSGGTFSTKTDKIESKQPQTSVGSKHKETSTAVPSVGQLKSIKKAATCEAKSLPTRGDIPTQSTGVQSGGVIRKRKLSDTTHERDHPSPSAIRGTNNNGGEVQSSSSIKIKVKKRKKSSSITNKVQSSPQDSAIKENLTECQDGGNKRDNKISEELDSSTLVSTDNIPITKISTSRDEQSSNDVMTVDANNDSVSDNPSNEAIPSCNQASMDEVDECDNEELKEDDGIGGYHNMLLESIKCIQQELDITPEPPADISTIPILSNETANNSCSEEGVSTSEEDLTINTEGVKAISGEGVAVNEEGVSINEDCTLPVDSEDFINELKGHEFTDEGSNADEITTESTTTKGTSNRELLPIESVSVDGDAVNNTTTDGIEHSNTKSSSATQTPSLNQEANESVPVKKIKRVRIAEDAEVIAIDHICPTESNNPMKWGDVPQLKPVLKNSNEQPVLKKLNQFDKKKRKRLIKYLKKCRDKEAVESTKLSRKKKAAADKKKNLKSNSTASSTGSSSKSKKSGAKNSKLLLEINSDCIISSSAVRERTPSLRAIEAIQASEVVIADPRRSSKRKQVINLLKPPPSNPLYMPPTLEDLTNEPTTSKSKESRRKAPPPRSKSTVKQQEEEQPVYQPTTEPLVLPGKGNKKKRERRKELKEERKLEIMRQKQSKSKKLKLEKKRQKSKVIKPKVFRSQGCQMPYTTLSDHHRISFRSAPHFKNEDRCPVPIASCSTQTEDGTVENNDMTTPATPPSATEVPDERFTKDRIWLMDDPVESNSCSRCVGLCPVLSHILIETEEDISPSISNKRIEKNNLIILLYQLRILFTLSSKLARLKLHHPYKHRLHFLIIALCRLESCAVSLSLSKPLQPIEDNSDQQASTMGNVFYTLGSLLLHINTTLLRIHELATISQRLNTLVENCILVVGFLRIDMASSTTSNGIGPEDFLQNIKANRKAVVDALTSSADVSDSFTDIDNLIEVCHDRVDQAQCNLDEANDLQLNACKDFVVAYSNKCQALEAVEEDEISDESCSARTTWIYKQWRQLKHSFIESTATLCQAKQSLVRALTLPGAIDILSEPIIEGCDSTRTDDELTTKQIVHKILAYKLHSMIERHTAQSGLPLTSDKIWKMISILFQQYSKRIEAVIAKDRLLKRLDAQKRVITHRSPLMDLMVAQSSNKEHTDTQSLSGSNRAPLTTVTGRLDSISRLPSREFTNIADVISTARKCINRLNSKVISVKSTPSMGGSPVLVQPISPSVAEAVESFTCTSTLSPIVSPVDTNQSFDHNTSPKATIASSNSCDSSVIPHTSDSLSSYLDNPATPPTSTPFNADDLLNNDCIAELTSTVQPNNSSSCTSSEVIPSCTSTGVVSFCTSNETVTSSRVPCTSSTVPCTSSEVPCTGSGVPCTSSAVPYTGSTVPCTSSAAVPCCTSSEAVSSSTIPCINNEVPCTTSEVPCTNSGVLCTSSTVLCTSSEVLCTSSTVPSTSNGVSQSNQTSVDEISSLKRLNDPPATTAVIHSNQPQPPGGLPLLPNTSVHRGPHQHSSLGNINRILTSKDSSNAVYVQTLMHHPNTAGPSCRPSTIISKNTVDAMLKGHVQRQTAMIRTHCDKPTSAGNVVLTPGTLSDGIATANSQTITTNTKTMAEPTSKDEALNNLLYIGVKPASVAKPSTVPLPTSSSGLQPIGHHSRPIVHSQPIGHLRPSTAPQVMVHSPNVSQSIVRPSIVSSVPQPIIRPSNIPVRPSIVSSVPVRPSIVSGVPVRSSIVPSVPVHASIVPSVPQPLVRPSNVSIRPAIVSTVTQPIVHPLSTSSNALHTSVSPSLIAPSTQQKQSSQGAINHIFSLLNNIYSNLGHSINITALQAQLLQQVPSLLRSNQPNAAGQRLVAQNTVPTQPQQVRQQLSPTVADIINGIVYLNNSKSPLLELMTRNKCNNILRTPSSTCTLPITTSNVTRAIQPSPSNTRPLITATVIPNVVSCSVPHTTSASTTITTQSSITQQQQQGTVTTIDDDSKTEKSTTDKQETTQSTDPSEPGAIKETLEPVRSDSNARQEKDKPDREHSEHMDTIECQKDRESEPACTTNAHGSNDDESTDSNITAVDEKLLGSVESTVESKTDNAIKPLSLTSRTNTTIDYLSSPAATADFTPINNSPVSLMEDMVMPVLFMESDCDDEANTHCSVSKSSTTHQLSSVMTDSSLTKEPSSTNEGKRLMKGNDPSLEQNTTLSGISESGSSKLAQNVPELTILASEKISSDFMQSLSEVNINKDTPKDTKEGNISITEFPESAIFNSKWHNVVGSTTPSSTKTTTTVIPPQLPEPAASVSGRSEARVLDTPPSSSSTTSVVSTKLSLTTAVTGTNLQLKWSLDVDDNSLESQIEYYNICFAKLPDKSHFTFEGLCGAQWSSLSDIGALLLPMTATLANLQEGQNYVFIIKGLLKTGKKAIYSDIKLVEIN